MIYGVAILSGCMFLGTFIGNLLGLATGLNSDVGGVGFAMLPLLNSFTPKADKAVAEREVEE